MKKVYSLLAVSALTLAATQASAAVYNITVEMTTSTTTSLQNLSGSVTTLTPGTGTMDTDTGMVSATGLVLDSQQLMSGIIPITGIITVAVELDTANTSGTQTRTACTNTSASPMTCNGAVAVGQVIPIAGLSNHTWLGGETTGAEIDYSVNASSPSPLGGTLFNVGTFTVTIGSEVSAVPVPAAAWLFGSALVGLAGIGRKRS